MHQQVYLKRFVCIFFILLSQCMSAAFAERTARLEDSSPISKITEIPKNYHQYMVLPWDLLKIPKFKKNYHKLLTEAKENRDWVRNLILVSNQNNKFYKTSEGDYFIYDGFRQRTNFYIRIIFKSDLSNMAYRVEEYSENGSSYAYYGNTTAISKFLLDEAK